MSKTNRANLKSVRKMEDDLSDQKDVQSPGGHEMAIGRILKKMRKMTSGAEKSKGGSAAIDLSLIRNSELFDVTWYLQQYPDVAAAGVDPHMHYFLHGAREGRDPGPGFNTTHYLRSYPDVAENGINPLLHFLRHGQYEGRFPLPQLGRTESARFIPEKLDKILERAGKGYPPADVGTSPAKQTDSKESGVVPTKSSKAVNVTTATSTLERKSEALKRESKELGKGQPPIASKEQTSLSKKALPSKSIRGNVDIVDEKGIAGWSVDTTRPGHPVSISLSVDGQFVLSVATSRARPDVSRAGMDGKVAGFFISFPPGLLFPGQEIEVRADGVLLKNGSTTLKLVKPRGNIPLPEYLSVFRRRAIPPVTVVVPVFNAWEATSRCLEALSKNLIPDAEVLIMDDASPDDRIPELLKKYSGIPGFRVHRNSKNIGYTENVNAAIKICAGRDVVLLNSDTVVTRGWLWNLRYCAYSQSHVATVTALSDNSGAFSVPEFGKFNPRPEHLSADDVGYIVRQSGKGYGLPVPTGNGFCMYIKRALIEEVGGFDNKKFPRGYGEENDFCMRAMYAGWVNLVCDKAYVLHQRSQSFQEEKTELIAAGAKQLLKEYPEYKILTQRFSDMEFSLLRSRIRGRLESARRDNILPRILYVISTQTGGTPQTNLDLMRGMRGRYDCWLLHSDGVRLTLSHLEENGLVEVEIRDLSAEMEPYTHRSSEYDRIVLDMMYRNSIDLLHIRHTAWHSLGLAEAAKSLGIPVVYSVHDFYSVCYSVNLIDENNRYCGVDPLGKKLNLLWPKYNLPEEFSFRWRKSMREFMGSCDRLITTTPSAVSIFSSVYPDQKEKFEVIPHGRDFEKFSFVGACPAPGERVRVLVPGNISIAKGALLFEQLSKLDKDNQFEFHFLGKTVSQIKHFGVHHGEYARDEFQKRVAEIKPHVGMILSIWPETYCHTLTEMWVCGIPVFGIDLGAVGDRIRATGCGWNIMPEASPQEVFAFLKKAIRDGKEFSRKLEAVGNWQAGEGTYGTTANMASKYREIYYPLLQPQFKPLSRVGVLLRGEKGRDTGTMDDVRILRPLIAASAEGALDVRPVSMSWLMAGGASQLDILVVQDGAISSNDASKFSEVLKRIGLPWIYDADGGEFADAEIQDLALEASLVTCASDIVATSLKKKVRHIEIIENALDDDAWLAPLSQDFVAEVARRYGFKSGVQRLLYVSSKSNAVDVEILDLALKEVIEKIPTLHVIQIGGGKQLSMADIIEVPKSISSYHDYVSWFKALCKNSTMAVSPFIEESSDKIADLTYLDYALAGIPAVYGNVPAYKNIVDGRSGLIVKGNDPESWAFAVLKILNEKTLRSHIRKNATNSLCLLQRDGVARKWMKAVRFLCDRRER